jgi:predicted murein hydrolase (TIGR00659 family)
MEALVSELTTQSLYFGVVITLSCYFLSVKIKKKFNYVLLNPLLISMLLIIGILKLLNISYDTYNSGAKYITYFLTPATICLAVPLYQQMTLLRKHITAILVAIAAGVLSNMTLILGLSIFFKMNHQMYVTMLPKSITTAIAIGLSEELGGIPTITIAAIIITGLLGNIFAEIICKGFRITEPIAVGLAIGNSAHALGTAKAIEIGEIEGAMSGLAIVISGVMTVTLANVFALFY